MALATTSSALGAPARAPGGGTHGAAQPAGDCEPFARTPCLLPFPNDLFTRNDGSTATGLRVSLPAEAMPRSLSGERIAVAEYDRNDGFSPGQHARGARAGA